MRWGYLDYLWISAAPILVLALYAFGNWRRGLQLKRARRASAGAETFSVAIPPERRILKRFCFLCDRTPHARCPSSSAWARANDRSQSGY